jgi:hypothetical protein
MGRGWNEPVMRAAAAVADSALQYLLALRRMTPTRPVG